MHFLYGKRMQDDSLLLDSLAGALVKRESFSWVGSLVSQAVTEGMSLLRFASAMQRLRLPVQLSHDLISPLGRQVFQMAAATFVFGRHK
jgi:hypothetical protein